MPDGTLRAIKDIEHERRRQVTDEGWTPEHDDIHGEGQMARAASAYAMFAALPDNSRVPALLPSFFACRIFGRTEQLWPWDSDWWKPKDKRRDLVRAGALIVAEIERLDRAAKKQK